MPIIAFDKDYDFEGPDGGCGTTYIADPKANLVAIPLTQRNERPERLRINAEFLKLAYEAIEAEAME